MSLTPAQKRFARSILRGDREHRAAHAAGVKLSTVKRWRRSPTWHGEVVGYQRDILIEELMPQVKKMLTRSRSTVTLGKLLEFLTPAIAPGSEPPRSFFDLAKLAQSDQAKEGQPPENPGEH